MALVQLGAAFDSGFVVAFFLERYDEEIVGATCRDLPLRGIQVVGSACSGQRKTPAVSRMSFSYIEIRAFTSSYKLYSSEEL